MKAKIFVFILSCFCSCYTIAQSSSSDSTQTFNSMKFLDKVVGNWYSVVDSVTLKKNPQFASSISFKFEWTSSSKKIMNFYEAVPNGDVTKAILTCQIVENPRSGEILFQGYQSKNDFYYTGRYLPLKENDGFLRIYEVHYPEGTKFQNENDRKKSIKTYRTICKLASKDSMTCTIEQLNLGLWESWGNGKPWHLYRK